MISSLNKFNFCEFYQHTKNMSNYESVDAVDTIGKWRSWSCHVHIESSDTISGTKVIDAAKHDTMKSK